MPNAIGDGWLVAVAVALIPILFATSRSVANHWRVPLEAYKAENGVLKKEAVQRTEELTDEKISRKVLEARLESCQAELEHWRSGKWQAPR